MNIYILDFRCQKQTFAEKNQFFIILPQWKLKNSTSDHELIFDSKIDIGSFYIQKTILDLDKIKGTLLRTSCKILSCSESMFLKMNFKHRTQQHFNSQLVCLLPMFKENH